MLIKVQGKSIFAAVVFLFLFLAYFQIHLQSYTGVILMSV